MAQADTAAQGLGRDETASGRHFWALTLGSVGVVYGDIGTSPLCLPRGGDRRSRQRRRPARGGGRGALAHPLGAHVDRDVEVRGCAAARRQRRRGRHLRPDGARSTRGPRQRVPAARARHRRRRVLLRRCRDHARDLGAFGSRGPQARRSRPRAVRRARRAPGHHRPISCCSRTARRASRASSAITVVWFVAVAGELAHIIDDPGAGHQSAYGIAFAACAWSASVHRARPHFPGGDGAEALYADLGHFGRRPIQTPGWGSCFRLALNYLARVRCARPPRRDRNPFYRLYPEWALMPMVVLAHPRHGDRQPGGHYGRLLADEPGDPAGYSRVRRQAPRADVGPDLSAARQLDAARCRRARRDVSRPRARWRRRTAWRSRPIW